MPEIRTFEPLRALVPTNVDEGAYRSFSCHTRPRGTRIRVARRAWRHAAVRSPISTHHPKPQGLFLARKCHHVSLQGELAYVTGQHQRPQ
jgi:hypothetical protein